VFGRAEPGEGHQIDGIRRLVPEMDRLVHRA
jgi:hypothetical protein